MQVIMLADLPRICAQLAERIRSDGFAPSIILYVETAGWPITLHMKEHFPVPLHGVRAERRGKRLKRSAAGLLRFLPRSVKHALRAAELRLNIHELFSGRSASMEQMELATKRILVVDDAVDTGNTIREVVELLIGRGARRENIRIAAITQTLSMPVARPDFVVYDSICSFPWSPDHPEREVYEGLYAR